MLQVPERAAALDRWYEGEVVCGGRRVSGPLESPGVPRIASSGFAPEIRPEKVPQENQNPRSLEKNSDGYDEVPGVPPAPRFVGVNPSRHAQQSKTEKKTQCRTALES